MDDFFLKYGVLKKHSKGLGELIFIEKMPNVVCLFPRIMKKLVFIIVVYFLGVDSLL